MEVGDARGSRVTPTGLGPALGWGLESPLPPVGAANRVHRDAGNRRPPNGLSSPPQGLLSCHLSHQGIHSWSLCPKGLGRGHLEEQSRRPGLCRLKAGRAHSGRLPSGVWGATPAPSW